MYIIESCEHPPQRRNKRCLILDMCSVNVRTSDSLEEYWCRCIGMTQTSP